jgi:hypothetical protein
MYPWDLQYSAQNVEILNSRGQLEVPTEAVIS